VGFFGGSGTRKKNWKHMFGHPYVGEKEPAVLLILGISGKGGKKICGVLEVLVRKESVYSRVTGGAPHFHDQP